MRVCMEVKTLGKEKPPLVLTLEFTNRDEIDDLRTIVVRACSDSRPGIKAFAMALHDQIEASLSDDY